MVGYKNKWGLHTTSTSSHFPNNLVFHKLVKTSTWYNLLMPKTTSEQVKHIPNPTGKGGFVKGVSGNPGGRPKNDQRVSWWMQQFLNMTKEEYESQDLTGKPMAALVAKEAFDKRKDLAERKELLDRTEGRAIQTLAGDADKPLTILFDSVSNNLND